MGDADSNASGAPEPDCLDLVSGARRAKADCGHCNRDQTHTLLQKQWSSAHLAGYAFGTSLPTQGISASDERGVVWVGPGDTRRYTRSV